MVSVTHAIPRNDAAPPILLLSEGLTPEEHEKVGAALSLARLHYQQSRLSTGELTITHALGMALICAALRLDASSRVAALLFAIGEHVSNADQMLERDFGREVVSLVNGLTKLNGLRPLTHLAAHASTSEVRAHTEILRKMMLAMVADIRVVLLRLVSRTQTLRYYTEHDEPQRVQVARESQDIYAPLANRLGIWQLKWELEDLSFRFLEPETYKRIAKMLDERRSEREAFIHSAIERLHIELSEVGIAAEIQGRAKHIYSIYNKMRDKKVDFSRIYDIRAVRVLVERVEDCYTVLDVVNRIWEPIPAEYDDYITRPKGNHYQSLHTAVYAEDGRSLEVQIRTHDMHRHAELGVAAHWRYKEGSGHVGGYDEKIALLRSLLSWRDEVADSAEWIERFKRASLDDTIYLLTPQGRVIDLRAGATPVDFAYRLHTELGHRCRGAKVDGQLVPLNTRLKSGQTVEITTVKEGAPSRDWLNPQLGYIATHRARSKIKQYFSQLDEAELLVRGRSFVTKEMQREGQAQVNVDELAGRLGFKSAETLFIAAGRGEVGPRALQTGLREPQVPSTTEVEPKIVLGRSRSGDASGKVLVVGVGKLMTSLSRCCKPAPPDVIQGFVTRGRGVSIHRVGCKDFRRLLVQQPERVIEATWGGDAFNGPLSVFSVDIMVEAMDRQGLLRDISEVLSREKFNVTGANSLTKKGKAYIRFTLEVAGTTQIQQATSLISQVPDVIDARRR